MSRLVEMFVETIKFIAVAVEEAEILAHILYVGLFISGVASGHHVVAEVLHKLWHWLF